MRRPRASLTSYQGEGAPAAVLRGACMGGLQGRWEGTLPLVLSLGHPGRQWKRPGLLGALFPPGTRLGGPALVGRVSGTVHKLGVSPQAVINPEHPNLASRAPLPLLLSRLRSCRGSSSAGAPLSALPCSASPPRCACPSCCATPPTRAGPSSGATRPPPAWQVRTDRQLRGQKLCRVSQNLCGMGCAGVTQATSRTSCLLNWLSAMLNLSVGPTACQPGSCSESGGQKSTEVCSG